MIADNIEKQWLIWDYVSLSWSEIGIGKDEFSSYLQKIEQYYPSWQDIKPIINDVLLCFAPQIPLMFAFFPMIPDWGYNKDYLTEKIQQWETRSKIMIWLNPLRLIGYPLAYLMALSYIYRLKKHYQKKVLTV
ncbi:MULTISPECIES: hypothetical protein [unclassified Moraxella]|uniref:hypothetical protein n=1 Tax=unclassified Moraxella TaxID=2685852 RepID=UPI003AF66D2F